MLHRIVRAQNFCKEKEDLLLNILEAYIEATGTHGSQKASVNC